MSDAPRRILIIRLDRIGDVILSTSVLPPLRRAYPDAFLAMMVRPACRDLVDGHPLLNEAILYDKDGAQHGVVATVRFALALRRYYFDTALVLHPTHRSHWIPWLAGIPTRVGYDRKSPWLLTQRLPHRKQEGSRHEADYTLDIVRALGIDPGAPSPIIARQPAAEQAIDARLAQLGVDRGRLIALHPSASCVSKRWMPERFAAVADQLIAEQRATVAIVAGKEDLLVAQAVVRAMRQKPIDFAGRLSLGELTALLARCRLLVSNDSGPVHVAAAVGTPVVAIFGRNERGLSSHRWGPVGAGHIVLHKEVGCEVCLAHRCQIAFKCLTALEPDEVYRAAASILDRPPASAR